MPMRLSVNRKWQNSMNWRHLSAQKNKIWLWTVVDHFKAGILGWVVGDHSAETFTPLWNFVMLWNCYFYVSDGNRVYPLFIPDEDHIVSKTYMTWVELVGIIRAIFSA
jgi:IS1 family transposase